MHQKAPLVSVTMINYNGIPWLSIAVESVLATTGVEIELIIVDDCSTDGSRDYLTEVAKTDSRVRPLFLDKNLGISAARNAGIDAARGTYISLIDSDDRFLPDTVTRQLQAYKRLSVDTPDLSLLTSDAWLINEAGERKGRYISREWWGQETADSSPVWCLPSTFFFRRDHSARFHAPFRSADAPLFVGRMRSLGPMGFCGEPLVEYRLRMGSETAQRGRDMLHNMHATMLSYRDNRLDDPYSLEKTPYPKWREVVAWVAGRNAKSAAVNGKYLQAALEVIKAACARPGLTCEKLIRSFQTMGKKSWS